MRKIALLLENSREYGREMVRGIADFYQTRRDTELEMVEADDILRPGALKAYDGIIARVVTQRECAALRAARIPVVDVLCQYDDTGFLRADSDHRTIGEMAADYFLGYGFRAFAFFGFAGAAFSEARLAGYAGRLHALGHACSVFRADRIDRASIYAERTQAVRHPGPLLRWLRGLPRQTALFCANDIRAYQALRLAAEAGIAVPGDLAVLGVDNDPLVCAFAKPQLSSIDPAAHEVGRAAAKLLHAAIRGGAEPGTSVAPPPRGIVARASAVFRHDGPPWFQAALDYIHANPDRHVSTADLVRLTGLSHTSVEKAFRRHLGESAGRYILRLKMTEARRLLALGGVSCKEVAYRIGFASPQYFCRVFRRDFGRAPFAPKRRR